MRILAVDEAQAGTNISHILQRLPLSVSCLDVAQAQSDAIIDALEKAPYRHVVVDCMDRSLGATIASDVLKRFPSQSVILVSPSRYSGGKSFPTLTVIPSVRHIGEVLAPSKSCL